MDAQRYDALLDDLHSFGPLYPGHGYLLANHVPMAMDALYWLERSDAIEALVARERAALAPLGTGSVIPLRDRMLALGDASRVADWICSFEDDLARDGVELTLRVAVPLLTPGVLAASMHGLIRTAHALRAYRAHPSAARLSEIAHGLGSWAASFQLLPGLEARPTPLSSSAGRGSVAAGARLGALEWLERCPPLDPAQRVPGLLHEVVLPLAGDAAWLAHVPALGAIQWSPELSAAVAQLAARQLTSDPLGRTAHAHGTTVASCFSMLAPWLSQGDLSRLFRYTVLAIGAVHAASASAGSSSTPGAAEPELDAAPADARRPQDVRRDPSTLPELIQRAVSSEDDHAIKLTEAVARLLRQGHDSRELAPAEAKVLLNAAQTWIEWVEG